MANDSFTASPNLSGAKELWDKLTALRSMNDGKILRGAVRAGMKPANASAKARLAEINTTNRAFRTYRGRWVAPGFASRNTRVITTVSKDKNQSVAILGVRKEAFYAVQFLELGTSKMARRPWLRPAFYGTSAEQQKSMVLYLQKCIDKIAKTGKP